LSFLDRARGAAATAWESIAATLKLPRARVSAPEPFAAVEDGTPSADALLEPNAVFQRQKDGKRGSPRREKIDFRAVLAAIVRNKSLAAALGAALLLLVALAVTGILVRLPQKPLRDAAGVTLEGSRAAGRMIAPPETSFRPRMEMEREGEPAYTVEDAVEAGVDWDAIDLDALKARNDAALDELFRTVR
jgi:hypothetical protein